jgi:hypothetical protein
LLNSDHGLGYSNMTNFILTITCFRERLKQKNYLKGV